MTPSRTCLATGCDRSLDTLRKDARYCGDACRRRANRKPDPQTLSIRTFWDGYRRSRAGRTGKTARRAQTIPETGRAVRNYTAALLLVLAAALPLLASPIAHARENVSDQGVQLVADFERFPNGGRPYNDPVGYCTQGYGYLIRYANCTAADLRRPTWSKTYALKLLRSELNGKYADYVRRCAPSPLGQNRFDATVSAVYNLGGGLVCGDTGFARALRASDWQRAADELLRWNRAGGEVLAGLTRRRQAERALFLKTEVIQVLTGKERRLLDELKDWRARVAKTGQPWTSSRNRYARRRADAIKSWLRGRVAELRKLDPKVQARGERVRLMSAAIGGKPVATVAVVPNKATPDVARLKVLPRTAPAGDRKSDNRCVYASPPFTRGDKGRDVAVIQGALRKHGLGLKVTKQYDVATKKSVRTIQRRARLKQDGIVGSRTLAKLDLSVCPARLPSTKTLRRTVAVDGTPTYGSLAYILQRQKQRGWTGSLTSSDRRRGVPERFGRRSQYALYQCWINRVPGCNPANPPGRSTHEQRSDGLAYAGPPGRLLEPWQLGMDVTQTETLIRLARADGFDLRLTYPGSVRERQHVNLYANPTRRLCQLKLVRC